MLSASDFEKQLLQSSSSQSSTSAGGNNNNPQQMQQQQQQQQTTSSRRSLQVPSAISTQQNQQQQNLTSPPRRDTPHPSQGITADVGGIPSSASLAGMTAKEMAALRRQLALQQRQRLQSQQEEKEKQKQQQQAEQNAANASPRSSQRQTPSSPALRTPRKSSSSSSASPRTPTAHHHISQPKSPSRSSLEQITPKDFEYLTKPLDNRITTQITTLTNYESDPTFQFGQTIATNASLMVYGLRAGLLRTMNRYNGTTALFHSHKRHITDLAFKPNSNILASASQDKTLVIWKIDPDRLTEDESSKGANAIQLVLKQPIDENHAFFKRIVWDPTRKATLIALRSDNSLVALEVNDLMNQINSTEDKEVEFSFDLNGVQLLAEASPTVKTNDITFSRDNKFLATGDDRGVVNIYDVTNYELKKSFSSFSGSVFSVRFCGGKHRSKANSYLIVGGENNATFKVWNLADLKVPQLVQSVRLLPGAQIDGASQAAPNGSGNMQILNHVEIDEYSQYLFAANMEDNAIYALHLNENVSATDDGAFQFDSVSEFSTKNRVVSYTMETRDMGSGTFMFGIFCMTTKEMGLIHFSSSDAAQKASRGSPRLPAEARSEEDTIDDTPDVVLPQQAQSQAKIHYPQAVRASSSPSSRGSPSSATTPSDLPQQNASFANLEQSIISKIAVMMEQQRQQLRAEIEMERQRLIQEDQQRQQELLRVVSETLAQDVPDQLAGIVDDNMNDHVVPSIKKSMDALSKKLNKKMDDTVKRQVQDSFKESFNTGLREVLLPSFEKMVGSMLEQLTRVFANGLEEQLKVPLKKYYKEVNDDAVKRLSEQLNAAIQKANFGQGTVTTVQEETSEKKSATQEILSLLERKQYEQAFARVLSVHDVNFVVWTCKQVDPDDIFEQDPVPLSQAVILSLMQQISFDFSHDMEMKLDWIQKAALSLDTSDATISHHVPSVLGHIHQQLTKASSQYPQKAKKFRVVNHVIHSLTSMRQ